MNVVHYAKAPPQRDDDGESSDLDNLLGSTIDDRERRPRIRCPKCRWEPSAHDRWSCSCLHRWNTFDTRGICPGCSRQWHDTQCHRCEKWSKHEDWYEK
jgi:hypothetical protein